MANTFYTEVKYLSDGITAFGNSLVPLAAFSTKFTKDTAGGSMVVPLISAGAASTGYANVEGADTIAAVTVPLTRVFKNVEFTQEEANVNSVDLTSRYTAALQSIGATINQIALNPVSGYTLSVTAPVQTGFNFTHVASTQSALDGADTPDGSRFLVVRGAMKAALSPKASDGIKLDVQSYGFEDIYRSNLLPVGVSGAAVHPGTIALGSALPASPLKGTAQIMDYAVIEDPEGKNPAIQMIVKPNYTTNGVTVCFETLIGSALAQAGKGVKIA